MSSITSAFMIDISMSFKFYYLPTFRKYFSVFLIFLFGPGVFCCQHFSGPSRVSDYFRPVERGLRLDGDLERLWWKLFIHVNSDLSEISQEQLWLLDTSASRGRQSVAKMMTSFAFSCLSHHRGEIGDSEIPRFPVNVLTEHRVLSLPLDDRPTVSPPPDPKPVIWSVSMGFRLRPLT